MTIIYARSWLFFATLLFTCLQHVVSNPIEVQRDISDLLLANSLDAPLEKRAPKLYDKTELPALKSLASKVAKNLLPGDVIFCVGNSGR